MTAENLLQFLQHPQNLRRVSYQELKTLAMEYPYSAHINQLLLLKSKLSDQKDLPADLARAAAGSPDRTHLKEVMAHFETELLKSKHIIAESLELKPASEVEALLAGIRSNREIPTPNTPPELIQSLAVHPQPATLSPQVPEFSLSGNEETAIEDNSVAQAELQAINEEADFVPEPLDKSAFKSWNRHRKLVLNRPVGSPTAEQQQHTTENLYHTAPLVGAPNLSDQQSDDAPDLDHLAAVSIAEKQGVASETLATLLARQGNFQKAIEMYERLILLFPEKSAYFAGQIEKLKK
jgi:hypothetical protein